MLLLALAIACTDPGPDPGADPGADSGADSGAEVSEDRPGESDTASADDGLDLREAPVTPPDTDSPPDTGDPASGDGEQEFTLYTERFPDGIQVELRYPTGETLLAQGAPVVVMVQGGWSPDAIPVSEPRIAVGHGLVQVYFNLPGGDAPRSTPGDLDWRGARSRETLAEVLGWAAGEIPERDGDTLADRLPVPLADLPPFVHGSSNGGNLVLATLADTDLDLPELAGLVTFETPFSAQFTAVELGSCILQLPAYEPGSCAWEPATGLVCGVDDEGLYWDPDLELVMAGFEGAAWYDADGDEIYDQGVDYPVWSVRPDEQVYYSPTLTQKLADRGYSDDRIASLEETEAFWAERDGSLQVEAAAERFAALPVIILGTEEDHISGAPDHAHVSGMAHALQAAGFSWVRVNPDASYMAALVDEAIPWADNPANSAPTPGDSQVDMEPDENRTGYLRSWYSAAAMVELVERTETETWDTDLDARLTGAVKSASPPETPP